MVGKKRGELRVIVSNSLEEVVFLQASLAEKIARKVSRVAYRGIELGLGLN